MDSSQSTHQKKKKKQKKEEKEIIEAVISSVDPGLPLRDMLEIKRGLTLNTLHHLKGPL